MPGRNRKAALRIEIKCCRSLKHFFLPEVVEFPYIPT